VVICPICQTKNNISFFSKLNNYLYYLCKRCLTLFLYPQSNKKQLSNYYKNFEYRNGLKSEKNIRLRSKKILLTLKKINSSGKTLLDIGSGFGFFLDEANMAGFITEGIEPSLKLFRYIDISNKVHNINFDKYYQVNSTKKFDFITLIHVIEHINEPKKMFSKITRLLNPNGILYIETPNLNSHLFKAEKQNYTFLTPPDHLWIFSKNSFNYFLTRNLTLKLIKSSSYSETEHFMGIIKSIFKKPVDKIKVIKPAKKVLNINITLKKRLKMLLFDKVIANLLTPSLNMFEKGSILELYFKKK